MQRHYLEMMRAHTDEGGKLSHQNGLDLLTEIERLHKILDTPVLELFVSAVASEARHQIYRWGEEHDAKKTAWDWFWLLGHLGSKAAHSALAGDWVKAKHQTITAAAALANWHRHICAQEQPADGN